MPASNMNMRLVWDMRSIEALEAKIEKTKAELYVEVGEGMVMVIRSLIRNRTGELAKSWHAYRRGSNVVLASKTPYTYASVKGAFIRPTSKKALRFEAGGGEVFSKVVRYAPGAYRGRAHGVGSSKSYLDDARERFGVVCRKAWGDAVGRGLASSFHATSLGFGTRRSW
jgi:hypothetical protein